MKKIVALWTLCFLLLSVCPVLSFAENVAEEKSEIYFEKNFEDSYYGSNSPFDNITVRKSGNNIGTEVDASGNRYMIFEKYSPTYSYGAGEGNSNIEKILTGAAEEEKLVIQFDVMPKDVATRIGVMLTDSGGTNTHSVWLVDKKVCNTENILKANEWTTIRIFCDFSSDKHYVKVFANDTKIDERETSLSNFWRVRFHSEKSYAAGTYCFDNFVFYSGEPIFDSSVYNLDYKSIVYADNNTIDGVSAISIYGDYIIDGVKGKDANLVKFSNGRFLISCKKLNEIFNAEINIGGYLLYDTALAAVGKDAEYDDLGFVYWNDDGGATELSDKSKWILHNNLMYERPSAEYLIENIKTSHPRLSIPEGRIDEIKEEIKTNEYAKWYYETGKTRIKSFYSDKLLNDPSDKQNVMMKARTLLSRVQNLALWYHLMDDNADGDAEEYEVKENVKNRIWENIEAVINDEDFPHWQPNSGLDNTEMAAAVSYAYDWLYEAWSDEQKKAMEEALYKKALVYAMKNYGGQIGGNSSWWINASNSNQNAVINGGYILCALAIMDKYPKEAGFVLEKAIRSVEKFQNSFYPDGAWLEGTTYWTYSMKYWVPSVSSIKISYGSDFGMTHAPGLEKSVEYIMHAASINENNNYHDSEQNLSVYSMGSFYGLSKLYNESSWADWKLTYDRIRTVYSGLSTLINFPASAADVLIDINLPKDAVIKRDAVGSFRENWLDRNGMFLSYHGGYAYPGHGHCDTGTFVYEYDGVRFAVDLPSESYSFTGNLLDTYRTRPEGHNCLVINPDLSPGHDTSAFSPIEKFETNKYGGYSVLNMTDAYKNYASSVRRGFKTDDNRNSMIIRDEIKGIKSAGKTYWFMHTYADTEIEINDNAKTAVLKRKGKSIKFELLTNAQNFELKEMAAEPLDSSPQIANQTVNSNYKKIAVIADCAENENMYIQVKLSPMGEDVGLAENMPIDTWKCNDFTEIICEDGGIIHAEVNEKNLFPFIAVYEGKKLYSIHFAKDNSYDGMTAQCILPEENAISAKLYVWNSEEKLGPVIEPVPINKKE